MKDKLIVVSGPTASGKTRTSIEIAKHIEKNLNRNAAIVNFDSLLFYKEISIGTAKPSLKERDGIEHYMIDIESINSPMNASGFIKKGEEVIIELFKKNKVVILVGGSAFYLRALLKGMYDSPTAPKELKDGITQKYKFEGITPFINFLKDNDPQSLLNLHENDHYRLMRAVEYFQLTGSKISDKKKEHDQLNPYDFSTINHPWDVIHFYLDLPKDEHFEIIKKRTMEMFDQGLMEEVKELEINGFFMTEKPLASIGYKEALELKNGLFENIDLCIERISISTRQLAKAQRTFFNKITPKESFNPINDQDKIKIRVTSFLKE